MNKNVIGIDISHSAVSAVLVRSESGDRKISAYARTALADKDVWDCVAETLDVLRQKTDIADAVCVAALPDYYLSYRTIIMPFADRRKIDKIIAYELEPLLPFSPDEALIDFDVLSATAEGEENTEYAVLTAGIQKTRLADWLAGFAGVGLDPELLIPRGMAAASVISFYNDNALFVDVDGAEVVTATVINKTVQRVRSFPVDRSPDRFPENLCHKLRQTLLAYEEETGTAFIPPTVIVAGEATRIDGFGETVGECLDVKPQVLDVADKSGLLTQGRPDHNWGPGRLEVALCLALLGDMRRNSFNFRQGLFAVSRKWRQYSDAALKAGFLVMLIVILGVSGFFYEMHQARTKIKTVKEAQAQVFNACFPDIPAAEVSLDRMKSELIAMRQDSGVPEEISRASYCVDILNDISRLMPTGIDVVVSRVVIGPDDAVLSGDTDAYNAVDMIKTKLAESNLFGKIDISSANMDKTDNRVHFKLMVELL